MGKIEQRLFDLEEYLIRNDDSADSSAYLTIVGIANDVSELESENAKLRKLCADMFKTIGNMDFERHTLADFKSIAEASECYDFGQSIAPDYEGCVRELGIEVKDA